jgi:hypothetical protein
MDELKDRRAERAKAVEELMASRGWEILKEEWDKIKQRAFVDLTNELLDDETLKSRQVVFNQINEWSNLPKIIIEEGKQALAEQNQGFFRAIKKNIPFLKEV